ncbi:hypothetical protein D3C71_1340670 [compost metagenome]
MDYKLAYKISSLCGKVYKIFKDQWKTNRRAYNRIISIKEQLSRCNEKTTYFSIGGNELKPERAIDILEEIKNYIDRMMPHVMQTLDLQNLRDEADSLITAIKLIEHEPSAWNQLK